MEGASRKGPMSDATLINEFDRLLAAMEADEVLGSTPRTGRGATPVASAPLAPLAPLVPLASVFNSVVKPEKNVLYFT